MTAQFIVSLGTILFVLFGVILPACAYLIFLERKIAAWTQDRIGPNRVGLIPYGKHFNWGLGQALVDGAKLLFKEDYNPPGADRALFLLAPMMVIVVAIMGWAVIPWGGMIQWQGQSISMAAAPIAIGVIYILATGSLAVYGVVVGGYASNNKYSFLGGLRATAQMLSYEIPMGLGVLIVLLMTHTPNAETIVEYQAVGGANHPWLIFAHPLLATIVFTAILAECNRAPFDLAEAEQELVGGYHTEYSSMKWALFFLAEYMHMITGSALFAVLFLGGWDLIPFAHLLPLVGKADAGGSIWPLVLWPLVKFLVFNGKIAVLLAIMMLVRWTLPRFRFDQLMRMAWRALIPVSLTLLVATGVIVFLDPPFAWLWCLGANLAVLVLLPALGQWVPQGPPVNRRVPLEGSRFSPAQPVKAP